QHAEVLLTTLIALLEHNGSPTHAAEALYCHRNTVIYRLKQIEQLTGRSLQVPRDRLLLVLALMAIGRSSRGAAPLHA
ncbi:MAG TPA: helix-turn-helix domain-containing protein, partial [Nocardioidaceae bacterium]